MRATALQKQNQLEKISNADSVYGSQPPVRYCPAPGVPAYCYDRTLSAHSTPQTLPLRLVPTCCKNYCSTLNGALSLIVWLSTPSFTLMMTLYLPGAKLASAIVFSSVN